MLIRFLSNVTDKVVSRLNQVCRVDLGRIRFDRWTSLAPLGSFWEPYAASGERVSVDGLQPRGIKGYDKTQ